RRSHVEGVVAVHAPARPRELLLDRGGAGRRRGGVRHLQDGGDAAQHGGATAALKILLVFVSGLAEMHLRVNDAGEDVQTRRVENLGGLRRTQGADRLNTPAAHADFGRRDAVRRRCDAAPDQKVEAFAHAALRTFTRSNMSMYCRTTAASENSFSTRL